MANSDTVQELKALAARSASRSASTSTRHLDLQAQTPVENDDDFRPARGCFVTGPALGLAAWIGIGGLTTGVYYGYRPVVNLADSIADSCKQAAHYLLSQSELDHLKPTLPKNVVMRERSPQSEPGA